MAITITRSRHVLRRAGVEVSQHNSADEAIERAIAHAVTNGPGSYTITTAGVTVNVTETVIRAAAPAPTPVPTPTPTPPPVPTPGGYTLARAVAGLPFAISLPTAPRISGSPVSVTPQTIGANLQSGRELVLEGVYGLLMITVPDVRLRLINGARINTLSLPSTQRVEVLGGSIGETDTGSNTTDLLFDRCSFSHPTGENNWRGQRIAILSSTMRMARYCAYSDAGTLADFIIANCDLQTNNANGTAPTYRLQGANRTVLVDSRSANTGSQSPYRVQAPGQRSTHHYCARNQLETTNGQVFLNGDNSNLDEVWFVGNKLYSNGGSFYLGEGAAGAPQRLTMTGNEGFGASFPRPGNTQFPYVTPPPFVIAA